MSVLTLIDSLLSLFSGSMKHPFSNIEEKEQAQNKMVRHVDEQLRIYYEDNDRKDYWSNADGKGKFAKWCEQNDYDDSHLLEEFNLYATETMIIEFDEDFPLKEGIIGQERDTKMFQILKYLYQGKDLLFLDIDQFQLIVSEKQIVETQKMYRKHVKTWGTDGDFTQLTDINILYFLTVSHIDKRMNLLLNLIDSYNRDIIAKLIKFKQQMDETDQKDLIEDKIGNEEERVEEWISCRPFVQELEQKIKTFSAKLNIAEIEKMITGKQASNSKTTKRRCVLDLQKLLLTYPKRIGSRLRLTGRLIDDNLDMVSKCITASATFINQLIHKEIPDGVGGVPFLIDFIILLKPSKAAVAHSRKDTNVESDDEDCDGYDKNVDNIAANSGNIVYHNDIIGNVANYLKQNKCKLFEGELSDIVDEKEDIDVESYGQIARKCIKEAFTKLRAQVKGQCGKYPQNRRVNIIIDRRDCYKTNPDDKDKLIVFEPPHGCNELSHVNIPECYFDLSRQCLIPRPGYMPWEGRNEKQKQYAFDSRKSSQGQILTLSYHVMAADAIKCYLLWNGQCHRFYPQDILELLPHLFVTNKENMEFVKSDEAKGLIIEMGGCIKDTKFEMFYRGINKWNKYQFPKRYPTVHDMP